jgi:hypothetical protein
MTASNTTALRQNEIIPKVPIEFGARLGRYRQGRKTLSLLSSNSKTKAKRNVWRRMGIT